MQQDVEQKLKQLEGMLAKLGNYNDKARDFAQGLNRLDDKLKQLNALGEKDPRHLDKMKGLLEDSKNLGDQLNNLKKVGFNLIDEVGPNVDSSPVRNELNDFDNKYNALNKKLLDSHGDLEKAAEIVNRFKMDLAEIQKELTSLEEKFDKFSSIGRSLKVVESQIDELEDFNNKLAAVHDKLKDAERDCAEIIAKGYTSDPTGLRGQVEDLNRRHDRLSDRAKSRMNELQQTLKDLRNFNAQLKDNMDKIKSNLREVEAFPPISREVDTIRSQQREFQAFTRSQIEPLANKVNEVNKMGSDLIQSASHNVNTGEVEGELEKHNELWNNLKMKLNERERKLDQALLQAGRFKDALNSVEKWLTETEEMVRNQKPPSSDYITLKAQLQEQKYLKKMLTDRQQSINSLQELGKELMENLDRAERTQIEKQLADIDRRFNALMSNCDERMRVLESTLPVAKEFSEKIVPLQNWLEAANRKLSTLQSYSIDQDKLAHRISEHKSFHEDVIDHQADFKDLANVAQKLIYLIGNDEEGRLVTNKVTELTDKYGKLMENSIALGKELNDALREISAFIAEHDKLADWLNRTDEQLSKYKVLNVQLDKLRQQNDEVKEIVADISQHQRNVEELVRTGQRLLKQFSGSDSLYIRQKVDAIQNKYNDIKGKANDKLDNIKQALAFAQKFYAALEEMGKWCDGAEDKLRTIESLSISQQNSIVNSLLAEVPSKRTLLDTIKSVGSDFARACPGQGASTISGHVSKCTQRFEAICDQLQRRNEKLRSLLEQNEAISIELDDLFNWFKNAERQLLEAEPIVPNRERLMTLLRETKSLNDQINQQKSRVRDVAGSVKRLLRDSEANEELETLNVRTEELKELANHVSQLCQDRLNAIEHALPLVEHFFDAHNELTQFFDEAENEVQMLAQPSIYPEQIRKQQEATKKLMQSVAAMKPVLDKLNKTGDELIKLLQRKSDARQIQQIIDTDNERYNKLKVTLRDRQNELENALQATSEFSDKLDGMLNALNQTHDQLKNAEPISAHVKKIKEQIGDNNAILDDLKKREPAYNAVKANAKEVISKAGKSDEPAIRDIRNKLDKLNDLWEEVHRMANDRGDNLDKALELAKKFWAELADCMRAIKQLEDSLNAQETPGVEPEKLKKQAQMLKEIKQEMDNTKPRVEHCKKTGEKLMKVCGEPDKPEVRKNIKDLDDAWDNVTSLYAKREQNLRDAMDKAMEFHEKMQNLQRFLDDAEKRFNRLGPIAADVQDIKRQIGELKDFKNFVDPHMLEVESLNRMAHDLLDNVPSSQAKPIRDAVNDINYRWKDLLKAIADRQNGLDKALLQLGQFQQALNDLLAWIAKVEKMLGDAQPIYGDPQVIEVELAKHKVLMNDIHAHQSNVDSLNQVGRQIIESELGSENARDTRHKLDNLNRRWDDLIKKADQRNSQLEDCLRQSQNLSQEIQDMLAWLNEIDSLVSTTKPVGGLPETAREQLNRFMEIYNELDNNRHKVETLLQNGDNYVSKAKEGAAPHLQHNLKLLKNKWESVLARANDRKIKLEIALKEATEFHEALQEFVDWLTSAEKYLNNLSPVSRVLDHVLQQIEEHKQFQKDIGQHRETMMALDKKGTHLKYFSQKQDVILIKNLLSSVQQRWDRVLTKTAERARALDHGFKEAKEFSDAWSDLMSWLEDAEKTLDNIQQLGNNPDLIKQTLARHKEFQRQLGAKQSSYDATMRFGKSLKDKAPKEDGPILQAMLDELKNKWNAVCNKSVDKQRQLEEALLFSGQFKDAIQALIEWLEKARHLLGYEQPVHGDLDTVKSLIDQHHKFVEDFKSRENNLNFVRKAAKDLVKSANPEDARQIMQQMETLEEKWKEIEQMMKDKKIRLDGALKEAERLHQAVHTLLEWLSEAELKLRFAGPLPESEEATLGQISEHERFLREMKQQELNKNSTIDMAQAILEKSHPNAIPVVKHWIIIIRSRWDEVESWATQREKRLNNNLKSLKDASELNDELITWLKKTEADLLRQEAEPLPEDVLQIERMVDDHQRLLDELDDRNVDVERVVKAYSPKKPQAGTKERKRVSSGRSSTPSRLEAELRNPKAIELLERWQTVCKLANDRMKQLKQGVGYNREAEKLKNVPTRSTDSLRTTRLGDQPKTESEMIQDEVQRQVGECTCMIRYKVYQVGDGKYRVSCLALFCKFDPLT